jgi:hypothetical protein
MLRTVLSVDESRPSAFRFVVRPKVGDKIGFWQKDALSHALVTALRHEAGPDGSGMLVVSARSI